MGGDVVPLHARGSPDVRFYQRLCTVEQYLLDGLAQKHPQREVLNRLGDVLDATVLAYAPDGSVEFATGAAPAATLWDAITARTRAVATELHLPDHGGWEAVAVPVVRPPGTHASQWLVVSTAHAVFERRLVKRAAQTAAGLLAALARLDDLALAQERAVRGSVLVELLARTDTRDRPALAMRAAALGLDFADPARIVVVTGRHGSPPDVEGACERLRALLDDTGAAHLDCIRSGELVACVQAEGAVLRVVASALVGDLPALGAGIGRPVVAPEGVRDSYRDARLAAAHTTHTADAVFEFAQFDVTQMLMSEVAEDRIRDKVASDLGPLQTKPELYETLAAFFEHDLDVVATAHSLHLHANTLRYRLSRIEQVLGRSLKQPATIAMLHIALTAQRP
jgi:sugar diacid utilization regulator